MNDSYLLWVGTFVFVSLFGLVSVGHVCDDSFIHDQVFEVFLLLIHHVLLEQCQFDVLEVFQIFVLVLQRLFWPIQLSDFLTLNTEILFVKSDHVVLRIGAGNRDPRLTLLFGTWLIWKRFVNLGWHIFGLFIDLLLFLAGLLQLDTADASVLGNLYLKFLHLLTIFTFSYKFLLKIDEINF